MFFRESGGHGRVAGHVVELAVNIVRNSIRLYLTAPIPASQRHLSRGAEEVTDRDAMPFKCPEDPTNTKFLS